MTYDQKRKVQAVLRWSLTILVPLAGWGFLQYNADLVHRAEYRLDRQKDSTQLDRIDRRTRKLLCRANPLDTDCPFP